MMIYNNNDIDNKGYSIKIDNNDDDDNNDYNINKYSNRTTISTQH